MDGICQSGIALCTWPFCRRCNNPRVAAELYGSNNSQGVHGTRPKPSCSLPLRGHPCRSWAVAEWSSSPDCCMLSRKGILQVYSIQRCYCVCILWSAPPQTQPESGFSYLRFFLIQAIIAKTALSASLQVRILSELWTLDIYWQEPEMSNPH